MHRGWRHIHALRVKSTEKNAEDKCVLAPYFPSDNPERFLTVRSVFGAGNLSRILQNVQEEKREDALKSIVYEASARLSDPVYGCAGRVFELEKKLIDLQSQLAMAEEELRNVRSNLFCLADKPPLLDTQIIVGQQNDENWEELLLSDDLGSLWFMGATSILMDVVILLTKCTIDLNL